MLHRSIVLLSGILVVHALHAQSPAVLYSWNGTGNAQGWFQNFGTNAVTIANTNAGELTVTETGDVGTGSAVSDDFNAIFEGAPGGAGGIDLTGLSTLEIDVGHSGTGTVDVQFFVQAATTSTFVALGPDVAVGPAVATYSLPLSGLTPAQLAFVRTIGLNIRDHVSEGNLTWTIAEVRSVGSPLGQRDFVTHEPGTSDNGLQGAYVNFDQGSIQGNDGGQNQTGLSQNVSPLPAGNTGSLRWTDLGAGAGAAVSWVNGTVFGGNTYNERPTDMTNYQSLSIRMAATNIAGNVEALGVQFFLQTGNFDYHTAGPDQTLPADGQFHTLCFPLAGIPNLNFVVAHGVNLAAHAGGDLVIDVDGITTKASPCPPPPAAPALSPMGWALLMAALLAGGCLALRRRNVLASN